MGGPKCLLTLYHLISMCTEGFRERLQGRPSHSNLGSFYGPEFSFDRRRPFALVFAGRFANKAG